MQILQHLSLCLAKHTPIQEHDLYAVPNYQINWQHNYGVIIWIDADVCEH